MAMDFTGTDGQSKEDTLGEAGVASPALGAIAGCAYGVTQTGLSPMRGDTAAE